MAHGEFFDVGRFPTATLGSSTCATSMLANAIVDDAFDLEADIVARRGACINARAAPG